ncbi:MAG: hypothetical protein ABMA64_14390 [Myxococcota bacterium]
MSGSSDINVTPEFLAYSQDALDELSSRFFARKNRAVLQAEFANAANCDPAAALALFLHLERHGLARVWAVAYEAASGLYWCRFPLSQGPPPLPAELDEAGGHVVISSRDQLCYEISAVMKVSARLVAGPTR